MTKKNKCIYILALIFSGIWILRNGLVYSSSNDQVWTHYILWLHNHNLEDDLFYFSKYWEKSLWFALIIKIKELIFIKPLLLFYVLQIIHYFLFFFILFKIFNHFNNTVKLKYYFCFGLLISGTNFWISGAGVIFPDITFTTRAAPLILGLFSFYYLLNNKIYLCQILLSIASFMHLPTIVPFYLIIIIYLRKFDKFNYLILLVNAVSLLFFLFSKTNFYYSYNNYEIAQNLIKYRTDYLYIQNWSFDNTLRYFGAYVFLIIFYLFNRNEKSKNWFFILISAHFFYMITVIIFNFLPSFSTFKLGKELIIIIIIIFIIFLNLKLSNIYSYIIFYTAIFSQFIFGSFSIFLILFTTLYFFQTKSWKKKNFLMLWDSLYKKY